MQETLREVQCSTSRIIQRNILSIIRDALYCISGARLTKLFTSAIRIIYYNPNVKILNAVQKYEELTCVGCEDVGEQRWPNARDPSLPTDWHNWYRLMRDVTRTGCGNPRTRVTPLSAS